MLRNSLDSTLALKAVRLTGESPLGKRTPVCISHKAPQQYPVEHSLYFGRERLGRYVQLERKRFKAFDAHDRPLGNFRIRARALAAVRKVWARRG